MTGIKDKPGRRISLSTLVDHDQAKVQIIRRLHDTSGYVVDSGNMGYIPLSEWKAFLNEERTKAMNRPRLVDVFCGNSEQA
jgi:hypothetical protein